MIISTVRFALRKILRMAIILVSVTLIVFLLMHAIPGNPWSNYATAPRLLHGLDVDVALQRQISTHFGLDLPLWRQFTRYIIGDVNKDGSFFCGVVCGNLGPSIQQRGRPVQDVLFQPPKGMSFWKSRFGYSFRLLTLGLWIAIGLGVPLGILIAVRPKSVLSHAISVGLAGMISIPNFILGLLAIIVLASWLKIINVLPDWNDPGQWIVPALVLAVMPMASIARVTHATYMNILNEDFVRAARAKGLTQTRVILVHVLRNALAPMITFLGPVFMELFTGLLILENLYAFPGLGRGYWEAVLNMDYPMVMGLTLIYATGFLLINTLIELTCAVLDPRLRASQQQEAR